MTLVFMEKKEAGNFPLFFSPFFIRVCTSREVQVRNTWVLLLKYYCNRKLSLSVFLFFPPVLKHVLLLSLSSSRRFCFLLRRTNAEIWKNWNGRALKSRKYVPPHFHSKTQNSKGKLKKKKKRERERSSRFSKKKEALLRRERERERERRTLLQVLVLHLRIRSA